MKVYAVGGSVRDELLGLPVTDRDYVVVGATPAEMIELGYKPVGRDFPVFLHPETKEEYALARTERKTARDAKVEALRQCSHEKCEVVASITRGCGALARDNAKFSVQKGATRNEAQTKALKKCGSGCEILAWACTR